jgi:hypothetical protein
MDSGYVFVIVITVFSVGTLVYLEMKSRRKRDKEE